ncbi:hypothetical protein LTR70_008003 [Exophiala xenobiotica]|uniref:U4/U6.U5 small nuclear ribonucleoprotein 27kDa protein domain-containing protein n=1 Tax=Lithohypha guttulata TaxID=1690604 RepID=A0ABR0KLE2_9EURO|nr:hypothetical protein LTR24_001106 [Lithohypha guttulata]KAK5312748.1 hypothetical protein LTR70_008003 [Exophiala xenobiotica]
MDEPPAKRPRRDNRDRDYTASPRSPRPQDSRRPDDERNGYSRDSRRDDDRKRRRSRSPAPARDKHSSRRDRSRERDRPYRDRDRDRDRERYRTDRPRADRDRDRDHRFRKHSRSRTRSRSPPPPRNGATAPAKRPRSPAPPRSPRSDHDRQQPPKPETKSGTNGVKPEIPMKIDPDDEEAYMKRVMGFGGFRSTKNTKVPGNQWYAVRKEKKTEYRQYMNRVGGFNRPLSPSR